MTPPPPPIDPGHTPEEELEALARDGVEYRLNRIRTAGERRRSERGAFTIRLADLTMIGAILAIVVPILGVAFYVRDIANQVTIVVLEQTRAGQRSDDFERRIKQLETDEATMKQAAENRQHAIDDHEQRIRHLEGR